jgi:hypothetical protein
MSYYTEYLISKNKCEIISQSIWECRNIGLNKIVSKIYDRLIVNNLIQNTFKLKINCHDYSVTKSNNKNTIEFDCATVDLEDPEIFPDYVFGNWWHIGLQDYDSFVKDIVNYSNNPIINHKVFWIGNLQNIPQRIRYIELCKEYPDKLSYEVMSWINHSQPTKFIPIKELSQFKYLIDLTGTGCSGRLKLLTYCNRPLFITNRKFYSWSDIVILKQNLHISVKEDLSDLIVKVDLVDQNYNVFIDNAKSLQNFMLYNLNFNNAIDHAYSLILKKL